MTNWSGAGYGATATALLGSPPPLAPAPPTQEEPEPAEPAAEVQVDPQDERQELPGWWRTVLRKVTFRRYRGLEPEETWVVRTATRRALAPMPDVGMGTVVVAQPKGGVGRTTVAVLTACALRAFARRSPVLLDATNNAGGRWTLGEEVRTVEYLLTEPQGTVLSQVEAAALDQDDQAYQVLSCPPDPRDLTPQEFALVHAKLATRFTQVVVDTGATLGGSSLDSALAKADVVIVPTDLAPSTTLPTLALLDRLKGRWGSAAREHVVVVVTNPVPNPDSVWLEALRKVCAEVIDLPHDAHIAERGVIEWSRTSAQTRTACLRLAAAVTDAYRRTAKTI